MWKAIVNAFNGDSEQGAKDGHYNYDDIKELAAIPDPSKILLDVRERDEFSDGFIPGAVNMPYRSTPKALSLSPGEFKEKFGFEKPPKDKELIFYCASGFRAGNARKEAEAAGYSKTGVYPGSWKDWSAKGCGK